MELGTCFSCKTVADVDACIYCERNFCESCIDEHEYYCSGEAAEDEECQEDKREDFMEDEDD